MFCLPCLLKLLAAIAKPVCSTFCEECTRGVVGFTEENLSHDVHDLLLAAINSCMVIWEYFYFQATIRSYKYRRFLYNQQDTYESLTGLFMIWMLIINVWLCGLCLKNRVNSHGAYLTVKLAIVFVATLVYFLVPLVFVPTAWNYQFQDSCNGFGTRIYLDSNTTKPATSVKFESCNPDQKYVMEFQPNPQESNDDYNVFSLDPRYVPGSSAFIPTYDAVHYNFTSMTWTTKLYHNHVRNGSFELLPLLRIPELGVIADAQDFAYSETYEPFLRLYSTAEDEKILEKNQAWEDSTDVLMRTVKYSRTDMLQVCARALGDPMEGLGEMTPVPLGLLIILRARRMPLKTPSDGQL